MKYRILFLFALLLPMTVFAQSEHLSFKGTPIDGTLRQFNSELSKKGFIKLTEEDGLATLTGDFAGYKECLVFVSTVKQKDLVYATAVVFPPCSQWSSLETNYYSLKKMLTTKYGEPSQVIEEFQGSEPSTDSSKLLRLKLDECNFKTTFETEKGRIVLALAHEIQTGCHVVLGYIDKINEQFAKAAAIDDL